MTVQFLMPRIWLVLAVIVPGCASLHGTTSEQIGQRRVEYFMANHQTVPVVFENGLAGTVDWWAKVLPEVSKDTTVFAYNRPGYGKSDRVPTPRDGGHIVDELRGVLRSKGLNPPYILAGHSVGGLYMQLFARRYPSEVAALILVDSTHPAQFDGKGSPENWPLWFRLLFSTAMSAVANEEFSAINTTGEDVLALPTFVGKPVIVLSASQPMKETSELAVDANEKRKDFIRLYPGARQVWVDSGHGIPLEKPDVVIEAIREALNEVSRGPSVALVSHQNPAGIISGTVWR